VDQVGEQILLERIRDPIFRSISINAVEKKLIQTKPFQRLRYIKQLGFAYLPYPGATHTRFEHSLGTMHVASLLSGSAVGLDLSEDEIEEIRIEGLLHELGVFPFSYSFMDVIEKYCPRKEIMTERIISNTEIHDVLTKKYNVKTIAKNSSGAFFSTNEKGSKNVRYWILFSIIGANAIDFLLRDSYFTGVAYGKIDLFRLMANLEWTEDKPNVENEDLRDIIISLFFARRQMNSSVYFNWERRIADKMMCEVIESEIERGLLDLNIFTNLNEYLELDDESLWMKLEESLNNRKHAKVLRNVLKDLKSGHLFKRIQVSTNQDESWEGWKNILFSISEKKETEKAIAMELKIQPEQVILDSPLLYLVRYFGRRYKGEDTFLREIPEILEEKITFEEKLKKELCYVYVPMKVQEEDVVTASNKCLKR